MDIELRDINPAGSEADTVVFAFYEGRSGFECPVNDPETERTVLALIRTDEFTGSVGAVCSCTVFQNNTLRKVIIVGLGKIEELNFPVLRKAANAAVKEAVRINAKVLALPAFGRGSKVRECDSVRLISEISLLSMYSFDLYKSEKKKQSLRKLTIACLDPGSSAVQEGLREGCVLGKATISARDLVNEPANILSPAELAGRTADLGKRCGFEVEIFGEDKIRELGMHAFLEVARASDNPPRLIVLRYQGAGERGGDTIALVGKGLTYDTGGLSLKTNDGMDTMKRDMGGAASVIGAMAAIAELKVKAHVVGVIAACENMVSGRSYRPGDIIGSMAGKTILVGNTDAEGRLTLVDAIHYAIEKEGADKIVDLATLTGDATRAIGYAADIVIANDDMLYAELEKASEFSGERVWRMPVYDEYRDAVKSDIADLTNMSDKPKTITAGVFIGEFVQGKPWLHIDIAPTAWVNENKDYRSKGGTGTGVRTMYYLIKGLAEKG